MVWKCNESWLAFWRAEVACAEGSPASHLIRPVDDNSEGKDASGVHENGQVDEAKVAEREDGSEEVRAHKTAPRPYAPTKAEMTEHYPLHPKYRSWCADCVHGRATSAHHRSDHRQQGGVTWSMDYCSLGEACGVCDDEEETTDAVDGKRKMPILVAYDDVEGACWTLTCPAKGPTESVFEWCCSQLEDSGFRGYS